MTDWMPIRVRTEPAKIKHVQAEITGFPDRVVTRYYFQRLQSITASAVDVMKNYIKYNSAVFTETGMRRSQQGRGIAGRVDTGKMVDSIKWEGRKVGKNKYQFRFGWIDGEPGYSIFQEHGTKAGITGMESLAYTMEFVRAELKLMEAARGGYKTIRATPWSD